MTKQKLEMTGIWQISAYTYACVYLYLYLKILQHSALHDKVINIMLHVSLYLSIQIDNDSCIHQYIFSLSCSAVMLNFQVQNEEA